MARLAGCCTAAHHQGPREGIQVGGGQEGNGGRGHPPRYVGKVAQAQVQGAGVGTGTGGMEWVTPDVLPPPNTNSGGIFNIEVTGDDGQTYAMTALHSHVSQRTWALHRTIREAIYGVVKQGSRLTQDGDVWRLVPNERVAIKVIVKARLVGGAAEDPLKEIAIMQSMGPHANVMSLIEVLEDSRHIYLVLPFCNGGEICNWFEKKRHTLPENQARRYFRQMVAGLRHLHHHGIVHRDMSLENLLFDASDERVVIIDMGMALRLPTPARPGVAVFKSGYCGKVQYMSPEIFGNRDFVSCAPDVWALGVILFIFLTGIPPLRQPSPVDPRFQHIAAGNLSGLIQEWNLHHLSPEAIDLIDKMLQVDGRLRISPDAIASHPWLQVPDEPLPQDQQQQQQQHTQQQQQEQGGGGA